MPSRTGSHWPATAGYFAAFVMVGVVTATLGPTLPPLAAQAGADLDQISLLFTAHSLGYMAGSFLSGRLYDRMRGHPVMAGTLVLMSATLALLPVLPALWLLALAWLLVGAAGGSLDVGGNTLLVWLHGRGVGPYMNGLHFFFGVGSSLAPLIVALVLALGAVATRAYWVLAFLALPVAAWLVRARSPVASPAPAPGEPAGGSKGPVIRARVPDGTIVNLIALLLLLYVGAEVSYGGWIYSYALAQNLSDVESAAYLTAGFWGGLTAGRLLGIPLAARVRPRYILLAELLGCLFFVALVLIWPASLAVLWIGTVGLGAAMASIFPATITVAERRLAITGRITAWFLVGASVGGMVLPWLIGQLFESVGPQVTMLAILVDLLLALAAFGVLMWASKR